MSDLSFIRMFTDFWLEVRAPMPLLADGSKDTPPTVFTRNGKFNDGRLVWMYYNTRTKLFQMAVRRSGTAKPLTLLSRTDATRTFAATELEPEEGRTFDCDSGEWMSDKEIAEREHQETAAVLEREHAEVRAAWARNEELRKMAEEEARARSAKEEPSKLAVAINEIVAANPDLFTPKATTGPMLPKDEAIRRSKSERRHIHLEASPDDGVGVDCDF